MKTIASIVSGWRKKNSTKLILLSLLAICIGTIILLNWKKNMLYVDSGSYPVTVNQKSNLFSNRQIRDSKSSFGLDISESFSGNEFIFLPRYLPQIVNHVLYFALVFLASFFYIKTILNKNKGNSIPHIILSLFLTFNVFSIFLSGDFKYLGIIILLTTSISLFTKKEFSLRSFTLFLLSAHLVSGYPRILGISLILLLIHLVYILLYGKIHLSWNRIGTIFLFLVLTNIPFFLTYYYKFFGGIEVDSLTNYLDEYFSYGSHYYNEIKNNGFFSAITIKEPYVLHGKTMYKNYAFILINIVLFLGIPFLGITKKDIRPHWALYSMYALFLGILISPFLFDSSVFVSIIYRRLPFFANAIYRIAPIIFFILTLLIVQIFRSSKRNLTIFILISLSTYISYILLTLLFPTEPHTIWKNYHKIGVLENLSANDKTGIALSCPDKAILFNETPVWLSTDFFNNFQYPVSTNPRITTSTERLLGTFLYDFTKGNKEFFDIYKVVQYKRDRKPQYTYSFYSDIDYEKQNKLCMSHINDEGFSQTLENDSLSLFTHKDENRANHFLYSPSHIIRQDIKTFFSHKINNEIKYINIDPNQSHISLLVRYSKIPKENQHINISYKKSPLQPTKIYAKITNFDINHPFLIQFNQSFGIHRKLKRVNKSDFNKKQCTNTLASFDYTENSHCDYRAKVLDLTDIKYLRYPSISEDDHFKGNFIGNTRLIDPNTLPESAKQEKELYAVIIYEKQIWYNWALATSSAAFLVIFLRLGLRKRKQYLTKK